MISRIIILIVLMFVMPLPVYADKELEPNILHKVNEYRMTPREQRSVRMFVKRFAKKNASHTEIVRFVSAVNTISKRTKYQIYKHNPSDVLKGKADCQGYSIMLYLLLSSVDIPCKVIYDDNHMWNELCINGKWQTFDLSAYDSLDLLIMIE